MVGPNLSGVLIRGGNLDTDMYKKRWCEDTDESGQFAS